MPRGSAPAQGRWVAPVLGASTPCPDRVRRAYPLRMSRTRSAIAIVGASALLLAGCVPAAPSAGGAPSASATPGVGFGERARDLPTAMATLGSDPSDGWIVLVYADAAVDIEFMAVNDLSEMLAATAPNVTVVALIDRLEPGHPAEAPAGCDSPGACWDPTQDTVPGVPEEPDGGGQLIRIEGGEGLLAASLPDIDLADPAVLEEFVAGGLRAYPNRKSALVAIDHGNGWSGFVWDDDSVRLTGLDHLTVPGARDAIAAGLQRAGHGPLDIIGFDACLMAGVEVGYEFRTVADRMIASAELESAWFGWDWGFLDRITAGTSPDDFGRAAVEAFGHFWNSPPDWIRPYFSTQTLGFFDLTRFTNLMGELAYLGAWGAIADRLTDVGAPQDGGSVQIAVAASNAWGYGRDANPLQDAGAIDLGSLYAHLVAGPAGGYADSAQALGDVLDAVTIASYTQPALPREAIGLSVFLPPTRESFNSGFNSLDVYRTLDLTIDGQALWADFLDGMYDRLEEIPIPTPFDQGEVRATLDGSTIRVTAPFSRRGLVLRGSGSIATLVDGEPTVVSQFPLDLAGSPLSGSVPAAYATLSDGPNEVFATFQWRPDQSLLVLPAVYQRPDGSATGAKLVFDTAGRLVATLVDPGTGVPVEGELAADGLLYPLRAVRQDDGRLSWVPAELPLAADPAWLALGFYALPIDEVATAEVELQVANGQSFVSSTRIAG